MGSGAKVPTEFGARLRAFYEERELTRAEFAARVGSTEQSVYNWETGTEPSLEYAKRIADVTGWPVQEIGERRGQRERRLPAGAGALLREFARKYLRFDELSDRQVEQIAALEFRGERSVERLASFADVLLGYEPSAPVRAEETAAKAESEGVKKVRRRKR